MAGFTPMAIPFALRLSCIQYVYRTLHINTGFRIIPMTTFNATQAVSPALTRYTTDTVLDGLWKRSPLSPRDRSIVTVSALPTARARRFRITSTVPWTTA
ncbi:hypothetical protein F4827_003045 [Paraburkholderia bannensis]|uniref:Uncharacterized protein n=1 Tax=Paraburkholderia bannensis TaxID=765414 RepID=A0A7W9TZF4_9BURK|nr:hypothetical protein [Paraburkholderia sp. WP4_3_2]MBB6103190.1 hypothetical protein [Paraburkholderia bannensis]